MTDFHSTNQIPTEDQVLQEAKLRYEEDRGRMMIFAWAIAISVFYLIVGVAVWWFW